MTILGQLSVRGEDKLTGESYRVMADIDVSDFFDNMDSGSLLNLKRTGPGEFSLDVQSRELHRPQGSLMVWFHGGCNLDEYHISPGDALHMTVHQPNRLQHIRPVYSHNAEEWDYVPDTCSYIDGELRFEIPIQPNQPHIYFAAHFPYPSHRVSERAISQAGHPCVRSVEELGRTEQNRPILMLTITDPHVDDAGKRKVLLSAGSHAGETASLWGMEGIIDFLLSGDPESASILKQTIIYVTPMLNVDGAALGLDRRQATGVNIYFDYQLFQSTEARIMWAAVKRIMPDVWLDLHSWHLGIAEGAFGPDPSVVGQDKYDALVKPLAEAISKHFPINNWGADTLDCPNTQALLQLGIPGFCPEFNMGKGADGRWKTIEDQKALGVGILRGIISAK